MRTILALMVASLGITSPATTQAPQEGGASTQQCTYHQDSTTCTTWWEDSTQKCTWWVGDIQATQCTTWHH